MKKIFIFGLMAAVLGFVSCSKDDDDAIANVPVENVAFNVSTAELEIDGDADKATIKLTVTVTPENASDKSVIWKSSDAEVATVSSDGVVTAVNVGTATITVAAKDGSGKKATCTITVKKAGPTITAGTATRTGNVSVNWIQLWKNGPKFAEYNVGATSATEEGGYYCWGKSIDKDPHAAYKGGTDALTGDDDTATNLWGSAWRMPTQAELQALLANCDVEWTAVNGVNGHKFTGKGDYTSNSIFLPAAGYSYGDNVLDQGYNGLYWSSTPDGSNVVYYLDFYSGSQNMGISERAFGFSVRAVLAE